MTTYQEPKHLGDLLLVEVKPGWTKDSGVFAQSAAVYALGTVLAQAEGKYIAYDPVNAETAPASAIAAERVDAAAADKSGIVIARGATVAVDELVWPASITDTQRASATATLAALGIVARTQL